MDDLALWLGQQLDEDERIARRAAGLCGCHPPAASWTFRDGDGPADGRILVAGDPHPELKRKIGRRWNGSYEGLFMAEHVVRHDPEHVLREIDAKRKTLAQCRAAEERMDEAMRDDDKAAYQEARTRASTLYSVIRRDAAIYVDRPGYRDEWRP